MPYCGLESEHIIKNTKRKLYRLFKNPEKVKFNVFLQATKITRFNPNKDPTPFLSNSHVIYQYTCPGCSKTYVGKTDTTLYKRSKEHGWSQKDSAVFTHFSICQGYQDIITMFQLDNFGINEKEFQINTVRDNLTVLHRSNNWLTLSFMEALAIK